MNIVLLVVMLVLIVAHVRFFRLLVKAIKEFFDR